MKNQNSSNSIHILRNVLTCPEVYKTAKISINRIQDINLIFDFFKKAEKS